VILIKGQTMPAHFEVKMNELQRANSWKTDSSNTADVRKSLAPTHCHQTLKRSLLKELNCVLLMLVDSNAEDWLAVNQGEEDRKAARIAAAKEKFAQERKDAKAVLHCSALHCFQHRRC